MPKTKEKQKVFFTEKEEITDHDAPLVSGEFVTEDEDWRGQTVEVKADTKLQDDHGTGEAIVIRTFEFGVNPAAFFEYEKAHGTMPPAQEIFSSHRKGIAGMLWADGMSPADEIPPRVILSKDKKRYLIMVGARPSLGQTLTETPQTLSEIANPKQSDKRKH